MVTTSFPVGPNRTSGIFVKRLADVLSHHVDLTVLTPSTRQDVGLEASYKIKCFRYAPYQWQHLAHEPGGIPVALRSNRWLILLLPIFVLALFVNVLYHGRQVEVIHANWSVSGVIAGFAALLIRKPIITTLRGSDVNSIAYSTLTRQLMALTLRFNQSVVTVSEAIANEVCHYWPTRTDDVIVVPNGVDERLLVQTQVRNRDILTVTTIGNIIPLKDIGTIIRAFAKVKVNAQLRIVGEGLERPSLEILSKELGIGDRVIFTGALPPETIETELAQTDIFILSSHSEGRPNVILEAMAAGCAIISTDLPGVMELIDSNINGLLYKPGDVLALSENLLQLIDSEELRYRLGENARLRIDELGLTWTSCAARYVKLYNNLLEKH